MLQQRWGFHSKESLSSKDLKGVKEEAMLIIWVTVF